MANPFDNPKIFVDDVNVNYTNPTLGIVNGQKSGSWGEVNDPFAGAKSGLGGNTGSNNKELKLDAGKTLAKAKSEAKQPPKPKSITETLTDTFYSAIGIAPHVYGG